MNICTNCGEQTKNKKFCSQSCSAAHNNKGVRRHGKQPSICINCGKQCKAHRNKYCSVKCQQEYQYSSFISEWISGRKSGTANCGYNLSKYVRRYLFEATNNSCSKCGWNEVHPVTGNVPLQVNHIDGNWKNNRPENLEVLCPNCHSLTDNFGALNNSSVESRFTASNRINPQLTRKSKLIE